MKLFSIESLAAVSSILLSAIRRQKNNLLPYLASISKKHKLNLTALLQPLLFKSVMPKNGRKAGDRVLLSGDQVLVPGIFLQQTFPERKRHYKLHSACFELKRQGVLVLSHSYWRKLS